MKSKIMIGILILSLLGTTVYIIYDKIYDFQNAKAVEEEIEKKLKKEKEEEESDEEAIFELVEADVSDFMNKINVINTFLYNSYPFDDVGKIQNQSVLNFAINAIKKDLKIEGTLNGISADRLKTEVINYLGSDYSIIIGDIKCSENDGNLYQYDPREKYYYYVGEHAHQGIKFSNSKAYFQEGTYDKGEDLYTIKTKILSTEECTGVCGPNIKFYPGFTFEKVIYQSDKAEGEDFDEVYKEYKNKLPYYIYTFGKNKGGEYGLISVTYQNR